jgi:hypothetical protein
LLSLLPVLHTCRSCRTSAWRAVAALGNIPQ